MSGSLCDLSPVPASVSIETDPNRHPIHPIGSNVTLTCTVDLDPAVDVPVTVNTVWTGPNGVTLSPIDPVMVNLTRYTSTAMVSSFGRDQSGVYNCTATVSSNLSLSDTMVFQAARITVGMLCCYNTFIATPYLCMHTIGVHLLLRRVEYVDNSIIPIVEIGAGENALQCITDKAPCCGSNIGQWIFPDDSSVPELAGNASFYVSRGASDGTVNLNRVHDVTMPTGRFCCVVPDATGSNQTVCANIGEKFTAFAM